jgi:uncharacterized protein YndB with AHSA1/START domain
MPTIKKEYFIAVPPRILWDALTDTKQIEGWGAGPDAVMTMEEGGKFSFWGGDVTGKNLDIEPEKSLVQEWTMNGATTEVTVTLSEGEFEGEEGTNMTITQTDVPEAEVEEFDRGWDEYYAGPLKEFCEQLG